MKIVGRLKHLKNERKNKGDKKMKETTTKILMKKAEVCSTVSFRRLEKKLCLNRRQVRAALRRAENKGLLRYEEIAGRVYFRPTCATSICLK